MSIDSPSRTYVEPAMVPFFFIEPADSDAPSPVGKGSLVQMEDIRADEGPLMIMPLADPRRQSRFYCLDPAAPKLEACSRYKTESGATSDLARRCVYLSSREEVAQDVPGLSMLEEGVFLLEKNYQVLVLQNPRLMTRFNTCASIPACSPVMLSEAPVESSSSIALLSFDLLQEVFSYLKGAELPVCARVCRVWRSFIQEAPMLHLGCLSWMEEKNRDRSDLDFLYQNMGVFVSCAESYGGLGVDKKGCLIELYPHDAEVRKHPQLRGASVTDGIGSLVSSKIKLSIAREKYGYNRKAGWSSRRQCILFYPSDWPAGLSPEATMKVHSLLFACNRRSLSRMSSVKRTLVWFEAKLGSFLEKVDFAVDRTCTARLLFDASSNLIGLSLDGEGEEPEYMEGSSQSGENTRVLRLVFSIGISGYKEMEGSPKYKVNNQNACQLRYLMHLQSILRNHG